MASLSFVGVGCGLSRRFLSCVSFPENGARVWPFFWICLPGRGNGAYYTLETRRDSNIEDVSS
jgi:hypothetical protein